MINQKHQINLLTTSISQCAKCLLSKTRTKVVVGSGALTAQIIFIGEAPGSQEDKQGIPFVGRAGNLFDNLLASISLHRKDVYVANILKCRPPKNRNPKAIEIQQCTPYLEQQLKIINPKIIVPMGNFATRYFCDKFDCTFHKISKLHGKIISMNNEIFSGIIIPLYHPAAAIYNNKLEAILIKDFQIINEYL
jgi:DNA polymerase